MKIHPGILMILTWSIAIATFAVLPFQLETRSTTALGWLILALFIVMFVLGSFLATPILPRRTAPFTRLLDFVIIDRILLVAAAVTTVMQAYDIFTGNALDLNAAFQERNLRSTGALTGADTGGSLAFQIGFLFYPAGYVGLAREIMFRQKINIVRLGFIGILPVVLASISMGGRGPILYGIILAGLCWRARKLLFPRAETVDAGRVRGLQKFAIWVGATFVVLVAMNYFVEVFIARANVAGGVEAMQKVAALNWGVSFDGPGSAFLRNTIGEGNSYLIFAFVWYLVQGIVISNSLFTDYTAGLTYGVYGIDLGSAVARRVNPQFVSERFSSLFDLNIYGFLPSAFGSVFVDLWYFGLIAVAIWGYLAGMVYRKVHSSEDARWEMIGPFVTLGIIFSLINTPLGFGNGLMIHIWLVVALVMIRPVGLSQKPRFATA